MNPDIFQRLGLPSAISDCVRVLLLYLWTKVLTMPPLLNENGVLPPGIHSADWVEIEARFGLSTPARVRAFNKLKVLYKLVLLTGKLKRFVDFGSFVSDKAEPPDVDMALIMDADFEVEHCPRESQTLFSHADADARFGASVFWLREAMLPEAVM